MRTWHVEMTVVGAILGSVCLLTRGGVTEWVGAAAVLLSFGHAQVGDRLAEREAARPVAVVECYRRLGHYFAGKELLWLVYFVLHRSWAALVGVGIFLAYPGWRRLWRKKHPLGV